MPTYYSQSHDPVWFVGRHFMFVPIETPSIPSRQRFGGLIILSGVMTKYFYGDSTTHWRRDQVTLDLDEDFGRAIHLAPYTPPPAEQFSFSIEQAVPFASLDGREARGHPDGTAITGFWSSLGGPTIQIELAVLNSKSGTLRLGYHLSLYGHLVSSGVVAPEASTAQADAPAASTAQADAAADSLDK